MKRSGVVLAAIGLFAASCGGGSSSESDPPVTAEWVEETTTPPADTGGETGDPAAPQAADSLVEVRPAVVRIVGVGTFAEPGGDVQANVPGSGSGFIIDPSGLAVTNNHVVTGAGLIEVFVGDDPDPHNARVLGVSECSDLAVIDIDGDGYDFLDWADAPAAAGSEIFALGFPLGDEEYTVLDGVISKEEVPGADSWASVDAVVEHSADTLPGSSGGPIVTNDGRVVAVNYAGNEAGQSFAIGLDVARSVVETLSAGVDHESIGINGEALGDGTTSGIWVYSVKSGSPADVAGVQPGDLLTSMEGVQLADDGTMADYCDVIRSHAATDVLGIEVKRSSTDELLQGQLNGRQLEVIGGTPEEPANDPVQTGEPVPEPPADDVSDEVPDEPAPPPAADVGLEPGVPYGGYVTITDDSNLISMDVPTEWADVDGRLWSTDIVSGTEELIGPALSASPNLSAFRDTWGTPGVFLGASPILTWTPEEILDYTTFDGDCTFDERVPYDDGLYTGLTDRYVDCGLAGSEFMVIVAQPADISWTAELQIVMVTEADRDAVDAIISSWTVEALAG